MRRSILLALSLLPLGGCWWMLSDSMETRIETEMDPAFEIRNPNEGVLYEVEEVLDGDTIRVSGYDRPIHLLGVQAPGHSKTWNDFYAKDSYLYLKKLLEGRDVSLYDDRFDERPFRVWRGEVLAYVFLGGRLVNRHLIEMGYARLETEHSFHRRAEFAQAEARARRNKAGLWVAHP